MSASTRSKVAAISLVHGLRFLAFDKVGLVAITAEEIASSSMRYARQNGRLAIL